MQLQSKKHNNTLIKIVPFKKKYLQIFKGDYYYLLDRYKYDQNKIMMLLDLKKINTLGEKFRQYEDGVEKIEFIRLIKKELGSNPNDLMDETNLVYGLYKFFCEIDFNGDGHMQWEEFTQFIIDTVEGENQAKNNEGDEETTTGKILNEKLMQKYKRYEISQKIRDFYIHKTDIIDASYLPKSEILLIIEYNSTKIKVYNPVTGRIVRYLDVDQCYKAYEKNFNERNKENQIKKGNNKSLLISKTKNELSMFIQARKEEKIKSSESSVYSVISIHASTWIVAVCLSNSTILFFSFNSEGKSELIYKIKTPSLQKRVWCLPEHNIWFSSGCKEENDKYYYINELDIEFEMKNQKVLAFYNEGIPYRSRYCAINEHKDEIYDVIEINKPFLVLTACLDGIIRLININDKDYVKMWHNHSLGVKHLDYNPNIDSTGYIISTGFEYFINIYSTDLSIEEAYKGRLEGHYAPVVTCNFLANSHMCVSVDEEVNVRIWDSKLRLCLQMIPPNKKNFKVNNLIFMAKINKFIVYGNKMIFYDPKYTEEEKIDKNAKVDENFPIKINFNKYYQEFYITTLKDVRVYDKNGVMTKIFKKCRENEHFDPDVKIKYFIFENNYRKFYLGFSNGAVMQYNAGNGSLIKSINESETEKDGIQTFKYDHSKEITSMFYFYQYRENDENFLLITTSLDSLINIYNEYDPEETEKLRTFKGGHTIKNKKCDILCMDFSLTLCLLASGSAEGLIVIWDFEMSKIDDVCSIDPSQVKSKIDVVGLKFLDPYPLLFAYYSNGSCAMWGVKPLIKMKGQNILRFQTFYNSIFRVELCPITACAFINRELNSFENQFLFRKFFVDDEESIALRKIRPVDSVTGEILPEIEISEEYRYDNVDMELCPEKYASSDKMKYYLYLCDIKGYIRILDLKGLIRKYELEKASQIVIRSNFNILKKDNINVETILNHSLQKQKEIADYINLYQNKVIVREWKAHDEEITDICIIDEPFCVATIGKDKYFKIWNELCECIGEINLLPKISKYLRKCCDWNFKMDEKKILENEIKEVVRIFEEVGVDKIKIGSKEDAQAQKIEIEEKIEKDLGPILKPTEFHKKRYKPFDNNNKKKSNDDDKNNENRLNNSYEGLYLMEITKKIDGLINKGGYPEGMNEISNKIFTEIPKAKENAVEETKNTQKDDIIDHKTSNNNILLVSSNNENKNQLFNGIKDSPHPTKPAMLSSDGFKSRSSKSTTNINFYPMKQILNNKSSFFNLKNPNQTNNINSTAKHCHSKSFYNKRLNTPSFRSSLYSEKFLRHDDELASSTKTKKEHLLLPILKYEKKSRESRKFQKGETEKLLSYEFYCNSYKNCCQIHPSSGIDNASLAYHYKNMWRYVDAYTANEKKATKKDNTNEERFKRSTSDHFYRNGRNNKIRPQSNKTKPPIPHNSKKVFTHYKRK